MGVDYLTIDTGSSFDLVKIAQKALAGLFLDKNTEVVLTGNKFEVCNII